MMYIYIHTDTRAAVSPETAPGNETEINTAVEVKNMNATEITRKCSIPSQNTFTSMRLKSKSTYTHTRMHIYMYICKPYTIYMDTWMYLLHTITLYQNTPFRGQERRDGTKMAQTLSVNTNIKKQKHRETQRNTFY